MYGRVPTDNDITIRIKDANDTMMAGVQSYSIKCEIDYTKISAMGEHHPTDYYVNGRTYTITLQRVHLYNSSMYDGLSFYNKYNWKDFELIITKNAVGPGAQKREYVFRNCYRIECGEDGEVNDYVRDKMIVVCHNMGYEKDDTQYFRRRKMIYGGFTFPYNPYQTDFSSDRKYVEHKFPGLKNNDIEDFGANCGVINCEGYFYGTGAIATWKKLLKEYKKKGARKVYHPIFTSVTKGLMINLNGSIDAHNSLVKYSFDILEYNPPSVKKAKSSSKKSSSSSKKSTKKKSGKVKSKGELKVGNSVYLTGYCYHTSTGGNPRSSKKNHKKMTITKINSKNVSHPIHLGTVGWCKVSDLSWS